jgi:hypothetical protein
VSGPEDREGARVLRERHAVSCREGRSAVAARDPGGEGAARATDPDRGPRPPGRGHRCGTGHPSAIAYAELAGLPAEAGLQALEDLAGTLDADGIALHFARAKPPVADRVAERVRGARFHGTVRAAVHTAMRDEA